MKSSARTVWTGDLASGSGQSTLASGVTGPLAVSWKARTEGAAAHTTPEELLAAAHAICFCMALSAGLARNGTPPRRLEAEAVCVFGSSDSGFAIKSVALTVKGEVDGLSEAEFRQAAEAAKDGCPVSKALKGNVDLSVAASLI